MRHHFLERRRFFPGALHFAFELAVGKNLVRRGLLAGAIDLEIAQNDCALAVLLRKINGSGTNMRVA